MFDEFAFNEYGACISCLCGSQTALRPTSRAGAKTKFGMLLGSPNTAPPGQPGGGEIMMSLASGGQTALRPDKPGGGEIPSWHLQLVPLATGESGVDLWVYIGDTFPGLRLPSFCARSIAASRYLSRLYTLWLSTGAAAGPGFHE